MAKTIGSGVALWPAAAALTAALAFGLASQAQVLATGSTAKGQIVAQRYCSLCHAVDATGESPVAKAPAFRDLHKLIVVQDLEERLMIQMLNQHMDMPKFNLSAEEEDSLIAYLKAIQTRKAAALTTPVAQGPGRG
jgi:mono/diheme cytochrome c family protein